MLRSGLLPGQSARSVPLCCHTSTHLSLWLCAVARCPGGRTSSEPQRCHPFTALSLAVCYCALSKDFWPHRLQREQQDVLQNLYVRVPDVASGDTVQLAASEAVYPSPDMNAIRGNPGQIDQRLTPSYFKKKSETLSMG